MKLYLVNGSSMISIPFEPDYLLQTFYAMNKNIEKEVKEFIDRRGNDNFILDSGAFSLFNGSGKKMDYNAFKKYIDRYCDFIIKHDIENFLEMDLDVLIGYDEVKKINKYIESRVGRKPIYVWHHETRTYDDFRNAMKEADYVFWGGISKTGISNRDIAQSVINDAYSLGTRVHMLGYTPPDLGTIKNIYSADSSSWTMGSRNGTLYHFSNDTIKATPVDKDKKRIGVYILNNHNYKQWIKYQSYLKTKGWITN